MMTRKENADAGSTQPETGDAFENKKKTNVTAKILVQKKVDKLTGQTQYPKDLGYHGTDPEKNLNPEE